MTAKELRKKAQELLQKADELERRQAEKIGWFVLKNINRPDVENVVDEIKKLIEKEGI